MTTAPGRPAPIAISLFSPSPCGSLHIAFYPFALIRPENSLRFARRLRAFCRSCRALANDPSIAPFSPKALGMRSVAQAAACALPVLECASFQALGSGWPHPPIEHASKRLGELFSQHFPPEFSSPLADAQRKAFGFYLLKPGDDDAWLSAAAAFAADFEKAVIDPALAPISASRFSKNRRKL